MSDSCFGKSVEKKAAPGPQANVSLCGRTCVDTNCSIFARERVMHRSLHRSPEILEIVIGGGSKERKFLINSTFGLNTKKISFIFKRAA